MEDKRTFTVNKDGQDIVLYVKNPSLQENEEAESIRLKTWTRAVKEGAILAEKLNDVLLEQGIWSIEKETRQKEVQEDLIEAIRKIKRGGIKLKEARQLAIRVRQLRNELNMISMDRINYIDNCAEGQAQNRQFAYLVSVCTVYNDNHKKKYFGSFEDYLNRAKDVDAFLAANKCSESFYGTTDTSTWPENEFLKKYKFCDEKLRLINENKHLIDIDGKLINDVGDYVAIIDDKEVIVDENGNILPEISAESAPFLDDETGEPILEIKSHEEIKNPNI